MTVPVPAARTGDAVPILTDTRTVSVDGQEYTASPRQLERAPYYYPGGTIAGRNIPAGWYSTPWWKKAMIGGAAGLGGLLVLDALFGQHGGVGDFGHHSGRFEHLGGGPGSGFGDGFGGDWF